MNGPRRAPQLPFASFRTEQRVFGAIFGGKSGRSQTKDSRELPDATQSTGQRGAATGSMAARRVLLASLALGVHRRSSAEPGATAAAKPPPATLNGHPLKLDADGMIETWLPNATAHHDFITRAMGHIASLPPDAVTGLPVWLTHGQIPIYNNG